MVESPTIPKNRRPPKQPGFLDRIAGTFLSFLIKGLAATVRFQFIDPHQTGKLHPAIFCIWHNRLSLCLEVRSRYLRQFHSDRQLGVLVSASNDGALLSVVLKSYDVYPVRGSSSRRGSQALKELVTLQRNGYDLALTPDGPRGPKYKVQGGVISLGQLTGNPIVPVSLNFSSKWTLNSWDAFMIPKPFSKCHVRFGEPIQVSRDASPEDREELIRQLEEQLLVLGEGC
jgi:lysophospholipid acyltransferase (LPLAT)-like uncharacterized protein